MKATVQRLLDALKKDGRAEEEVSEDLLSLNKQGWTCFHMACFHLQLDAIRLFAIAAPEVMFAPKGAFAAWMQSRRALGGQNKVPRVVSDEDLFDDIAGFLNGFSGKERLE